MSLKVDIIRQRPFGTAKIDGLREFKIKKLAILLSSILAISILSAIQPAGAVPTCIQSQAIPKNPQIVPAPISVLSPLPTAITLSTNCGDIVIQLDSHAPVTITSLITLSRNKYFDNTACHRVTTAGIYVIQCGDPTMTGAGNPTGWKGYKDENLPASILNNYPAGTVAMANSGPGTNGSQFFFTYKDSTIGPNYSIWGHVISGMEILQYLGAKGTADLSRNDGPMALPLNIKSITEQNSEFLPTFNLGVMEGLRISNIQIDNLNTNIQKISSDLEETSNENKALKLQVVTLTKNLDSQLQQINIAQEALKSSSSKLLSSANLISNLKNQIAKICKSRPAPKGC